MAQRTSMNLTEQGIITLNEIEISSIEQTPKIMKRKGISTEICAIKYTLLL
jgi:hypothetical protein